MATVEELIERLPGASRDAVRAHVALVREYAEANASAHEAQSLRTAAERLAHEARLNAGRREKLLDGISHPPAGEASGDWFDDTLKQTRRMLRVREFSNGVWATPSTVAEVERTLQQARELEQSARDRRSDALMRLTIAEKPLVPGCGELVAEILAAARSEGL